MATTSFSDALLPLGGTDARPEAAPRPGFFARLLAAMIASREAQARREIARIRRCYGIETDLEVPARSRDLPFRE